MALRSRQGLQRGWRGRVCGSERIASTAGAALCGAFGDHRDGEERRALAWW